jgi:hypothetical protein
MNLKRNLLKLTCLLLMLHASSITNAQQWGNYLLYSLQNSSAAYLLDTNLAVAKTWSFASTARTGYSTYMIPGGTLVRTVAKSGTSFTGGPICGQVQKVDYNGNIVWDYVYSTTQYCSHHDICPMPNGNVLLIAYELKTATEATAAGSKSAIVMWPDKIVEIKPTGATTGDVVWEWHAWDHLVQNNDPTKNNYYANIVDHPELLNINYKTQKDWMHMNGIDYNPILDQIVFSSHNLNEWYVIDHSTTTAEAASHTGGNSGKGGDFLYRWGNPAAYGATGTTILNVTHDAHWIPEGVPNAGHLVGFNNKGVSQTQSAVDIINPPVNGYNYDYVAGTAYLPSTYLNRHACSGFSSNMGNSQQLPNGNTLVCLATAGKVYEINSSGTTLWTKTLTGSVPQAFKFNDCYVKNAAPAIPTISFANTTLTASNAATYQWYKNGVLLTNETNKTLTVTESGVYVVRVTDDIGCSYSYSQGYKYSNGSTGVLENIGGNEITLFPNPSNGAFHVRLNVAGVSEYFIKIVDLNGKEIFSGTNQEDISLQGNEAGIYIANITLNGTTNISKKIVINP